MRKLLLFWLSSYLMSQLNCSLSSEQPKSVVQAWPMVNLWNFSMSMTPTWATAQPNSSGRWFTQAAERKHSQTHRRLVYVNFKVNLKISSFSRQHTHLQAGHRWSLRWWSVWREKCIPPWRDIQLHTGSLWSSSACWPTCQLKGEKYKVFRLFISITESLNTSLFFF